MRRSLGRVRLPNRSVPCFVCPCVLQKPIHLLAGSANVPVLPHAALQTRGGNHFRNHSSCERRKSINSNQPPATGRYEATVILPLRGAERLKCFSKRPLGTERVVVQWEASVHECRSLILDLSCCEADCQQ